MNINQDTGTLLNLQTLLAEHPLFALGFLLIFGYSIGKIAGRLRLPEITGFIISGLMVGIFIPGNVVTEMNKSLHSVTEVAIGFLALTIGGELSARKMKRIGADIFTISILQMAITLLLVTGGLLLLNGFFDGIKAGLPYIALLAVIACATSPAVIVAEVHHLRAHGKFVDYLFGVVALSDTIAVLIFGMAFTIVTNLIDTAQSSYAVFYQSVIDISLSAALGFAAAFPLHVLRRKIQNPNELMIIVTGTVFLISGISMAFHLSPLLANMVLGAVLINISGKNFNLLRIIEPLTPPIYALFFVIAGIEINLAVFAHRPALVAGIAYILFRAAGKYAGTLAGCRIRRVEGTIARNLGLCMFSQGGVALGFVLLIQTSPAMAALQQHDRAFILLGNLVNIVFMSIFINELLSPFFIRHAVVKGNEME